MSIQKEDKRIINDRSFVELAPKSTHEYLKKKCHRKPKGYKIHWLVEEGTVDAFAKWRTAPGHYPQTIEVHSLPCYWATKALGMTTVDSSKKLKVSKSTIRQ